MHEIAAIVVGVVVLNVRIPAVRVEVVDLVVPLAGRGVLYLAVFLIAVISSPEHHRIPSLASVVRVIEHAAGNPAVRHRPAGAVPGEQSGYVVDVVEVRVPQYDVVACQDYHTFGASFESTVRDGVV